MSKGRILNWIKENIVFVVCIPGIIGFHWSWSKLQDNPYLVDQEQRKDIMPIVGAFKIFKRKIQENFNDVKQDEPQMEGYKK